MSGSAIRAGDAMSRLFTNMTGPEAARASSRTAPQAAGSDLFLQADGTAMPMLGLVRQFRDEFVAAAKTGLPEGTRHDDSAIALVDLPSAGTELVTTMMRGGFEPPWWA